MMNIKSKFHGLPPRRLEDIFEWAGGFLDDFQQSSDSCSRSDGERVQLVPVRWSPPPEDRFKINFDAAYFEDSGSAGIGVVCRDHSRQAIAALCQNLAKVQSAEMAEVLVA